MRRRRKNSKRRGFFEFIGDIFESILESIWK